MLKEVKSTYEFGEEGGPLEMPKGTEAYEIYGIEKATEFTQKIEKGISTPS